MIRLILLISAFFLFQELQADDTISKLNVTGTASLYKPSDKVSLKVAVVTQDQRVENALKANREKMENVIASLHQLGLTQKEYQTSGFTITPQYEPEPHKPQPNWHTSIIGYEVQNTLTIQTKQLDLIGQLIDSVGSEGANSIQEITFSLADKELAHTEAFIQAIKQAKTFADAAAKEAGLNLGKIIELTLHPSAITPRFFRAETFAMAATPISPQDVEVSASVSVVYEIL